MLTQDEMSRTTDLILDANADQLQLLAQVVNDSLKIERQKLARRNAAKITLGARVQVSDYVKPKYLARKTGTVLEVNGNKALVELDCGPINKFRTGKVRCPLSSLIHLEDN